MPFDDKVKKNVFTAIMAISSFMFIAMQGLAQTFSNSSLITINDNAPANPFSSNIAISGLNPTQLYSISSITFNGVSHTSTSDIDALLVAPTGYKTLLMSDNFGDLILNGVNLQFSDSASIPMGSSGNLSPAEIAAFFGTSFDTGGFGQPRANGGTGAFQTSNFGSGDAFSAPAPSGPYTNNSLSSFNALGSALNGQLFQLLVQDDAALDSGQISGGWQITFSAIAIPEANTMTIFLLLLPIAGVRLVLAKRGE